MVKFGKGATGPGGRVFHFCDHGQGGDRDESSWRAIRVIRSLKTRSGSALAEGGDNVGGADLKLPAAGDARRGALALWFDARRCFGLMPKNSAAQNRYQQLEKQLDFDVVLTANPAKDGQLVVTGDYHYAVDKFVRGEAIVATASGAAPAAAGVPGQLMDRCAQTLDFDAMIARLRQNLGQVQAAAGPTQVVVQKTVNSERDARFVLQASVAQEAKPAAVAAVSHLLP